ncbi:MAG TPA: thiamine phosphate synthase [Chitinophagales bacterium]|nr:thiamine phosphate synthase [Chitinophagales bacterium]
MYISRFHYLTQDILGYLHVEQVRLACENGVDWIQLRVKNKQRDEVIQIAKEAIAICKQHKVTLIINDHVEICKAVDADGVHLGKTDMPVKEARMFLGKDKIIGGTANTIEDIIRLYDDGVDYAGLGPFRFTRTKQNLSPVLGVEGYEKILTEMRNKYIQTPVIAIGGIRIDDVGMLMKSGIHGIAVSSAVHYVEDKLDVLKGFMSVFLD